MEDESFLSQWIAASFQESDHLQHSLLYEDHQQQLPAMIKSTSFREDWLSNNRPKKQLKANSWGSCIINDPTPSPEPHNNFSASNTNSHAAAASSFYYPPSPPGQFTLGRSDHHLVWNSTEGSYAMKSCQPSKSKTRTMCASARTPLAQDHVIAERKRREKLSQRFIALSAVVPGLKKTDKASVLTHAIKYLKKLQERVKTLEDQIRPKTVESVVVMKKSGENKPLANDDSVMKAEPDHEEVPEIEVRVCDEDVLIRIHCDNKKGAIEKVIGEASKLNLTVGNISALAFGSSALDITIVARMDAKCCKTVKELVSSLRVGFMSFM